MPKSVGRWRAIGASLVLGCSPADDSSDGEATSAAQTDSDATGRPTGDSMDSGASSSGVPSSDGSDASGSVDASTTGGTTDGSDATSSDESTTGAASEPPEPGLHLDQVLPTPEGERTFHYYVPADPGTEPLPLVLLLHGHGGSADNMLGLGGTSAPHAVWLTLADAQRILLAIPNGAIGSDDEQGWNDCRADAETNPETDDVAFLGSLIDELAALTILDEARVYAVGTSNGGHMALRLGLELSDRVRGVAPIVAAMPADSECGPPELPVPVVFVPGTDDPVSPYEGGPIWAADSGRGTVLSVADSVAFWVGHNGASSPPEVEARADLDTDDASTVVHHRYAPGPDGAGVELLEIVGGGHTEPSIAEQYGALWLALVGPQNHDVEMADEVWSFFDGG